MRVIERVIQYDHADDVFKLYFLTDWHLGAIFCDEELLDQHIAQIKADPHALWVGGGDYADLINRHDPRHRESNLAKWCWGEDDVALRQQERVCAKIEPIKDKCLALAKGNHEDAILQHSERDVYAALVETTTAPERPVRLGPGGFLVLRWRYGEPKKGGAKAASQVWTTVGFVHHGAGGGLLAGGHALTLQRLAMFYNFDFALLGHRHVRQVVTNEQWTPTHRATKIECRRQIMAFGGSYLKSFDETLETEGYGERKMLPPRSTGTVVLSFKPGQHLIEAIC